jgi:hypothetical protein
MLPPLCTWILANKQTCAQFALRGRRFCRAHEKLARIEQTNLDTRRMLQEIASSDLYSLIALLQNTLDDVMAHRISPNRAQLIFQATRQRFEQPETLILDDSDSPEPSFPDFDPGPGPDSPSPRLAPMQNFQRQPGPPAIRQAQPPAIPLSMEDVFGPRAAGMETPPDFDLNTFVRAMNDLKAAYSNDNSSRAAKTPLTARPSTASTLSHVK